MKKIGTVLMGVIALLSFGLAPIAEAATLNTPGQSVYDTLRVRNTTASGQYGSFAQANPGDTITVSVWYQNTSVNDDVAQNTRISLSPQNTGAGSTHTLSVNVSATNANTVSDSVTVSVNGNQTLTADLSSVRWYPGPSVSTQQALVNGQSGAELFSGGLLVGNVPRDPSPNAYGVITINFTVGNTGVNPPPGGGNPGTAPFVSTQSATAITQNTALLNAAVNPNGSQTNVWFEYGTSAGLGASTQSFPFGAGTNLVNVQQSLTNLSSNTTYYYRAMASNSFGTQQGSILSFNTGAGNNGGGGCVGAGCYGGGSFAPDVETSGTSAVGENYANLQGYINPNGGSTNVYFQYGTNPNSLNSQTTITGQGLSTSYFTITAAGLLPNTTYYFRAVGTNNQGTDYGSTLSFTTQGYGYVPCVGCTSGSGQTFLLNTNTATNVTLNSATLNGYVNTSGYTVTRWFEYGPTTSFGYSTPRITHGTASGSFSETITNISGNTTYYFRVAGQNTYGNTVYGQTLSFYTGGSGFVGGSSISTMLATQVSQTAARLNGLVLNNGNFVSGWFEYGSTPSLGNTTSAQSLGSAPAINFNQFIQGLTPNAVYYYRAVLQSNSGTVSRGDILSFRTNSGVVTVSSGGGAAVRQTNSGISIEKEVENLSSESARDEEVEAKAGDIVRFTIEVENTGNTTLRDLEIHDRIPEFLEFTNASDRTIRGVEKEVVWVIDELEPGDDVRVTLDARVSRDVPEGIDIENVARVEANGLSQTSNEAVIEIGRGSSNLGAALFFGDGSFLPDSLLEWLLLIIFILVLILMSRKLYGDYEMKKAAANHFN